MNTDLFQRLARLLEQLNLDSPIAERLLPDVDDSADDNEGDVDVDLDAPPDVDSAEPSGEVDLNLSDDDIKAVVQDALDDAVMTGLVLAIGTVAKDAGIDIDRAGLKAQEGVEAEIVARVKAEFVHQLRKISSSVSKFDVATRAARRQVYTKGLEGYERLRQRLLGKAAREQAAPVKEAISKPPKKRTAP